MKTHSDPIPASDAELLLASELHASPAWPALLGGQAPKLLDRMFRNPRVLEPSERGALIARLRQAVELTPQAPEIRVLLGMSLCVDLQVQQALEELRQAARIAPDCFIAHLKLGELLMRLRICAQAEEETSIAARLASNPIQSELARRQAATLRAMMREGIERGGYANLFARLFRFRRGSGRHAIVPAMIGSK